MDPISVEEAAHILGVSGRRVRVFIGEGRLPAVRVGARIFVLTRADAEALALVPRAAGRPRKSAGIHP